MSEDRMTTEIMGNTHGENEMSTSTTAGADTTTERPVIVCTEYRGVFFGYAGDTSGDTIHLRRARMAIYFGTTKGVMQLADTGPTPDSKISARADIDVRKVTAVFDVTPEAVAAWESA
jgi:hypothetical protein